MPTEYFFWFAQPSTFLGDYDKAALYAFAGLVALSVIVWLVKRFLVSHPVTKRLLSRYHNALFWIGMTGLIWFGFRYEVVPIFSRRAFAGGIILIGLAWLGWIKWYFLFRYRKDKQEHDTLQLKNKYIK